MMPNPAAAEENLSEQEQQKKKLEEQNRRFLFFLGALPVIPVYKQQNLHAAFSAIADPKKFAEALLDYQNPQQLIELNNLVKTVRKGFTDKKVGREGSLTAGFFPFKRVTLSFERVERRRQALEVAHRLSLQINEQELDLKIDSAIKNYQLDGDPAQIKQVIRLWRKENPERNLDEAIIHYYLFRKEGLSFTRLEDKNAQEELEYRYGQAKGRYRKELDRAGEAYLKETEGVRNRAIETVKKEESFQKLETLVRDILDPAQPFISDKVLEERINTIESPVKPPMMPVVQPTEAVLPEVAEPITAVLPVVVPVASQTEVPIPSARPISGLRERIHLPEGAGNIFGGAGNRLGPFFGGIGKRLGGALNKVSLAMNGAKTLLNTGLNALLPGLGTAVGKLNDTVKTLTGIDVEGAVVKLVVGVFIGIPVAIAFLLLFLNNSNSLPYYGNENAREVAMFNNNSLSWYEFEEKFLTQTKQKTNDQSFASVYTERSRSAQDKQPKIVSWQQFEKENLLPMDKHLSFDKK